MRRPYVKTVTEAVAGIEAGRAAFDGLGIRIIEVACSRMSEAAGHTWHRTRAIVNRAARAEKNESECWRFHLGPVPPRRRTTP